MQRSATIELPWPSARLNPNRQYKSRLAMARIKKPAKHGAMNECLAQGVPRNIGAERVVVGLVFLPPDSRRRDLDNCIASSKALLDGIASHIGVDDSRFVLSCEMGEPVKGGKVIVNLLWRERAAA